MYELTKLNQRERTGRKIKQMATIPIGSEFNLVMQIVAFALMLIGLRFAIRTHKAYAVQGKNAGKLETTHKNLMTTAVLVSGLGVLIWMAPSLILGWTYTPGGLGYGIGGYKSYFCCQTNFYLSHWYLLAAMFDLGTLSAIFGVYLVLRMRWSRFPKFLAVQDFRAVMIFTWVVWFLNVLIGFVVFYFFAFLQTA